VTQEKVPEMADFNTRTVQKFRGEKLNILITTAIRL